MPSGGVHTINAAGIGKHTHPTERLRTTRLRTCISTYLEAQGLTTPPDIARAVGLPPAEAQRLLTRRQWREGDVAALQAIVARLGLEVSLEGLGLPVGEGRVT
jgi:hypothetical protein